MQDAFSNDELEVPQERCEYRGSELRDNAVSKDEINALLSAYQSATSSASRTPVVREPEVRVYDFSRPDRFSKEQLRTLSAIHSGFASGLATTLSSVCQSRTTVDFTGVDQLSYTDYRASAPTKTLIAEVAMQQMSTSVLFEVDPTIVGLWVDCLCGGGPSLPGESSTLTPVDLAVAGRVLTSCLQVYADSWTGMSDLQPRVQRVVDSESNEDSILPSETVFVCGFEIHSGECIGTLTLCIPAAGVEAALSVLTDARAPQSPKAQDPTASKELRKAIAPVALPCRIVLGHASMPLSDVQSLEVGDVIRTDRPADAEVEFWAGDRQVFRCRPGVRGNKPAVVISSGLIPRDEEAPAE